MDAEKRKREDGKETEEKGVVVDDVVNDEEVEEFFAILRRIRVAVKYFERNNGGKRWKPSLSMDGFEDVDQPRRQSMVEKEDDDGFGDENTGLDLNLNPPSEDNSG